MELILIRSKVALYSIIGPIYLMQYISKGFNTFQYFNLSYIGIFPSGLVIVKMNRLIAELFLLTIISGENQEIYCYNNIIIPSTETRSPVPP